VVNAAAANLLPDELRHLASQAWAFRWRVELEAELRFAQLGQKLEAFDAPAALIDLANRASDDERRHAVLCAEVASEYGWREAETAVVSVPEICPSHLTKRQQLLYELVAACCITETESVSVLTTLLGEARGKRMCRVLHEIARDEVSHSRLGWAYLARERVLGDVRFLAPLIPVMLEGTVTDDLFAPAKEEREDAELFQHGVLPHSLQRSIFVQTMLGVVFPGLEANGIDSAPARKWLERKRAQVGR
jgi:hypothetical protein